MPEGGEQATAAAQRHQCRPLELIAACSQIGAALGQAALDGRLPLQFLASLDNILLRRLQKADSGFAALLVSC